MQELRWRASMAVKLTQAEAELLIAMLKKTAEKYQLKFPTGRGGIQFDVVGERRNDEFVVNIDRKGINAQGCTYQGRIKSNNVILLRLDVNPSAVHINPSNGEKIVGSHLHVYSEEYEMSEAIPFDVQDNDLLDLCYTFFEKFNIVEAPSITHQISMNGV
jgi:hypothetical protein